MTADNYEMDVELFDRPRSYAEGAPLYLSAGWHGVLPLPAGKKSPPPDDFTGRDGRWPSDEDLRCWARHSGNLGLRLHEDVVGIDVDQYGDKIGADELATLEQTWGPLPATWVSTARPAPSGIRLFRIPAGVELHDKPGSCIEVIQRHHRYMVCWPSRNPAAAGAQYRWITPDGEVADRPPRPDELPCLPDAWVEGMRADRPRQAGPRSPMSGDEPSPAVRKALATAVLDLSGGRHDAALLGVMALERLRQLDHPGADDALDALHDTFTIRATTGSAARSEKEAEAEWARMVDGAQAKVAATPASAPHWEERAPQNGNGHRSAEVREPPGDYPLGAAPRYVNGSQEPRRTEPTTVDLPRFLGDDWDDEEEPAPAPTILPVAGGVPGLIYAGKSHSVSGPAGHGKTFLLLAIIAWLVANDPDAVAVFVDYEDDRATFKFRLKALGVTAAQARRVAYWRVSDSIMHTSDTGVAWLEWVDQHHPTFVGFDSVSKACSAAGLNDESNPDYRRWDTAVIGPLDHRSITTLRVDHTGNDDGPGGPKNRTRGASAKTDAITGAAFMFRADTRFTKTSDGQATISVIKCRPGDMAAGDPIAIMDIAVRDSGDRLDITFRAPDAGHKAATEVFRPTGLMERVSRYLEAHCAAGGASKNAVEKDVQGNATYVRAALAQLVIEEYVVVEKHGQALMHRTVQPYREADDTLNEHGQERHQEQ